MSTTKRVALRPKLLSASIAAAIGTAATLPVQAQELEEVYVTGSRIVQRDFVANSPIVSVESEFFDNTSTLAVETVLNQLPQFVPAVTQFVTADVQPGPTNTTGANTISLRGLGPNRNLVLIDGRRAQPVNALLVVDTNTIPSAAIERVEVVTGGASATYGADAISGVVNFIMKKNFEGIEVDVQHGTTEAGDGAETRIAALFGANIADGRGNVMLGVERADRAEARQNGREFFDKRDTDPTMPGTNTFLTNTYYTSVAGNRPSREAIDSIYTQSPGAIADSATHWFNRDGTAFVANVPAGAYRYNDGMTGPAGIRKIRSDGTINENQQFRIASTPLERYSVFGRGFYNVTDSLELYAQANFIQTRAKTYQMWSPAIGGQWGAEIPYGPGIYEPSLGTNGETLAEYQAGGSRGLNCPAMGGCTNSQAFPVPDDLATLLDSRPDPDAPWLLNRVQDYLGVPRATDNEGRTFQLMAGVTGDIPGIDGTWDVYFSHGESQNLQHLLGFGDLTNYRSIVTQANYGRGAVSLSPGVTAPNTGAGGTATCTTGLPIFEHFQISEDCYNAVVANMVDTMFLKQDIVEGTVEGRIATLPAGELRFAAGASYRENEISYEPAHLNSKSNTATQPIGQFVANPARGTTDATDVFGEILVPIINGGDVINSFSVELGARYADYGDQGTNNTWKALFSLGVANERVRFRGGWQRANRAPNVGELFSPEDTVVQATSWGDPCRTNSRAPWSANPLSNPDYQRTLDLCSQLMGPTGAAAFYSVPETGEITFFSASVVSSGNQNLRSEEADTVTAGVVFQLENFNVSLDWYEMEITGLIGAINYDTVYEYCLSPGQNPAASPTNPFCQQIVRDQTTGGQQRVNVSYSNLGFYKTSGVDLQVNWRKQIGEGTFGVNFLASVLDEFLTQDLPTAPIIDWKGTGGEGGQFDYRLFTTFNYFQGPYAVSLRWRHYPSIAHSSYATNPNTLTRGADSYDVLDLNGRMDIGDRHELRFGIDNLLDTEPAIYGATPTSSGQGETLRSYYDVLGRRAYIGFKTRF